MLSTQSLGPKWIKYIAAKNPDIDNKLIERAIRIIFLLEGLSETDIDFVLKNETAFLLKSNIIIRSSNAINIVIPKRKNLLYKRLQEVALDKGFTKVVLYKRKLKEYLPKIQFRFYYQSVLGNQKKESLLLNISLEELPYYHVSYQEIDAPFILQDGYSLRIPTPSYNDLLGEKLALLYSKATENTPEQDAHSQYIEIIKQLFDIGKLFDRMSNTGIVSTTFHKFALTELACRNLPSTPQLILEDIFQIALAISTKGEDGNADFTALQKGILQNQYLTSSKYYSLEKATIQAAKMAYLIKLLQYQKRTFLRFGQPLLIKIRKPFSPKLNKLNKSDPEAFFYWFKTCELMK